MNQCADTHRGTRCERAEGHDRLHRAGNVVWGFRNAPEAAWIARMRAYGLPAKDMTGGAA